MKTYFYYAFHTLINQIRKLCRTWVVLILIAAGIGGFGIGYGAGMFSDQTADKEPSVQETQAADEAFSSIEDTFKNTFSSPAQAAETIACVLTIGTLVYQTVRAEEDGARFFQPADRVLLFTSPMKPQRVLLFRLMMQVGLFLYAGAHCGYRHSSAGSDSECLCLGLIDYIRTLSADLLVSADQAGSQVEEDSQCFLLQSSGSADFIYRSFCSFVWKSAIRCIGRYSFGFLAAVGAGIGLVKGNLRLRFFREFCFFTCLSASEYCRSYCVIEDHGFDES